MADDLTARTCTACAPGTPTLEEPEAAALQTQLDQAWTRDGTSRLHRDFRFPNFRDAFGFTAKLALLAEAEGHHPDLELGWGRVAVDLTTHAAHGLTDNDFIMAAKIDRL